ncbi:MAG: RDD family protein [Acidobacteria bacterium]|nr:RDD family protein [Acidobacteriota bacterium]MBI3426346.1 RDD family protein [Acidobacteriota bacterium]
MKCEKCACELPGSRVTCLQCGFNNAAQRADRWKAQRQAAQPNEQPLAEQVTAKVASKTLAETAPPTSPAPRSTASAAAARVRARYASEAKLLQFPVTAKPEAEAPKATASSEPAWRELARAKVREHQQRRNGDGDDNTPPTPVSDDPTSQLIVESALKRIRRTQAPPVVRALPRITRHSGGQAVARALQYDEQPVEEAPPATPVTAPEAPQPEPAPAPALRAVAAGPRVAPQPMSQVALASLRARLDTVVPNNTALSGVAENATAPMTDEAQVMPAPTPEQPVTPAEAAFEQQAELRAQTSKKSNVWIGKPAPIWLRALAGAVDLEAAALAYLPFFGAYTSLDGPPGWSDFYLMASILAVVLYLYQLITYSFNGRTFGMALCGLRCVDMTDASTPVPFNRRLWQALGGTIALLCPPLNYIVTRLTEHQRGLADALGQTITLRRAED